MDKDLIQVTLMVVGVLGAGIGLGVFNLLNYWEDVKNSQIVEVKIIDKVVKTIGSYTRSECVFDYQERRYTTDERPCLFVVGETINVGIFPNGRLDINSISRLN